MLDKILLAAGKQEKGKFRKRKESIHQDKGSSVCYIHKYPIIGRKKVISCWVIFFLNIFLKQVSKGNLHTSSGQTMGDYGKHSWTKVVTQQLYQNNQHILQQVVRRTAPGFDGKALNEKELIWEKLHNLLSANAIHGDSQYWGWV